MSGTFLVWNPRSGRAGEAREIRGRLAAQPNTLVRDTSSASEALEVAKAAAGQGFKVIVAAGGDGTVNSVANGLMQADADATMALLPMGTANDFASTLAIPDDLESAADLIASGVSRPIDLVELRTAHQRRCFANVAAGGNSDRVTESLTDDLKRTWGPLCYLRGAIGVLADLESYHVTVAWDDEPPLEINVWNILVANGRSNAGRLQVAPRANPEDGLLDVILIRDGPLVNLAQIGAKFVLGDYLESDEVIYRQARTFTLASEPRMRFSIDGEPIDAQPVTFRALHGALRMIVGPNYAPDPRVQKGVHPNP